MQKSLVGLSVLAISLGLAQRVLAQDPQVQRRSVTQETYNQQNTQAPGTAAQGPAAAVQTPVGGASAQTGSISAQTPSGQPSSIAQRTVTQEEVVMAQQNPPIRWSLLEGEVTHVDKVNNVVEIRLKGSKNRIGIPVVEKRVGIFRNGDHQYALKDIEPGDNVILRNLNTAANL